MFNLEFENGKVVSIACCNLFLLACKLYLLDKTSFNHDMTIKRG